MIQFILTINLIFSPQTDNQPNYLEYHKSIISAEHFIAKRKYKKALSEFENAFEKFDFVFLRDYKVASQIAYEAGDEAKALHYIRLAISKGWKLQDIRKNKFLLPLIKTPEWQSIESNYDSIRNNYFNSLNRPLRSKVHEMYKLDQKKALGALFRIGNKAQENYGTKKFAPHSEIQLAELDKILIEYGYPGEKMIGDDWWVSIIISHHNSSSHEYVINDTLFHYLKPKFLNAIKKGEMTPYELALMEDWKTAVETHHNKSSYGFIGAIQNKNMIKEININRTNIGMRSISLRNDLIDIETETGMNFYLPGQPWQDGKITLTNLK